MKKFKIEKVINIIEGYRTDIYHVQANSKDDINIKALDESDLIKTEIDIVVSEPLEQTLEQTIKEL